MSPGAGQQWSQGHNFGLITHSHQNQVELLSNTILSIPLKSFLFPYWGLVQVTTSGHSWNMRFQDLLAEKVSPRSKEKGNCHLVTIDHKETHGVFQTCQAVTGDNGRKQEGLWKVTGTHTAERLQDEESEHRQGVLPKSTIPRFSVHWALLRGRKSLPKRTVWLYMMRHYIKRELN